MVSGHDDIEFLDQAYDLGIIDILLKPINWKLLVYRMRYILNPPDNAEVTQPALNQQM